MLPKQSQYGSGLYFCFKTEPFLCIFRVNDNISELLECVTFSDKNKKDRK
jgi:hypothetical protein